jgi:DNA-binding LacI/PurR family transcriptional regulator
MESTTLPSSISKRLWLKQELEALIAAGQSGEQLPTYAEMLQRYQVGQGTVDYVVLQLAAEGKIERRKGLGLFITSLAKQRSIGVVYEWDTRQAGESPFDRRLIEKVRERVQGLGRHSSFYLHVPFEGESLSADRLALVKDIEAGRLEGLVVLGGENGPIAEHLRAQNVPHVLFSPFSNHSNQVGVDYRNLIEQGVSALAYSGSRRIGLISAFGAARLKDPSLQEDREAFMAALSRNRLDFIPEAVIEHKVDASSVPPSLRETNLEIGYWAATALFEGGNRLGLDGLVVLDDYYTQGVLLAFDDLGLRVHHDVRIATHAVKDCTPLRYRANKLILLETDIDAVVDALFRVLEKWMIQGARPERSLRLPVTLRLPLVS